MLAWKMKNTYLMGVPIQAHAGQVFNSSKTRVQSMAHARHAPLRGPTYVLHRMHACGGGGGGGVESVPIQCAVRNSHHLH